jgi:hypothetical protein
MATRYFFIWGNFGKQIKFKSKITDSSDKTNYLRAFVYDQQKTHAGKTCYQNKNPFYLLVYC